MKKELGGEPITIFIKRKGRKMDEPITTTKREANKLKKIFKGTDMEIEICDTLLSKFSADEIVHEYHKLFKGIETERWGIL